MQNPSRMVIVIPTVVNSSQLVLTCGGSWQWRGRSVVEAVGEVYLCRKHILMHLRNFHTPPVSAAAAHNLTEISPSRANEDRSLILSPVHHSRHHRSRTTSHLHPPLPRPPGPGSSIDLRPPAAPERIFRRDRTRVWHRSRVPAADPASNATACPGPARSARRRPPHPPPHPPPHAAARAHGSWSRAQDRAARAGSRARGGGELQWWRALAVRSSPRSTLAMGAEGGLAACGREAARAWSTGQRRWDRRRGNGWRPRSRIGWGSFNVSKSPHAVAI